MARIYLSATYSDLQEHREKAYRALRQLGHDVIAMEDYVATDQRPLDKCLEDVAASDVYVGIFAHRCGYIPDDNNPDRRSITELEYRHARALGKPCLVFLLDPAVPWTPAWMDVFTGSGDQGARIRALREELGRERLASFFTTSDQLAQQVSIAVTKQLDRVAASQRNYQLVEGLPAVPARRAWTIPPPVRSFTGREKQLAALREQLTGHGVATLVPAAALTGIGGVGKSQLALAYAQRYRADYELGWWVPAETDLGMLTALAELGVVLGMPEELAPAQLAARARDALGERSGWLLVFDNASDPAAVAEFLPGAGGGHILVTSRDPAWQGIANPVQVDLLPHADAVQLLLRRSGDADELAATQLAEELGRLPLALEQGAAYAAQNRLTLTQYLELFRERHAELLRRGAPLAYQGTVDATFTLALEQLRERSQPAVRLQSLVEWSDNHTVDEVVAAQGIDHGATCHLVRRGSVAEICALLAPDEIPLPLLLSDSHLLPEPLSLAVAEPLQRGEIVGQLFQAGLLIGDAAGTARIHRLVQHVTLSHLTDGDRRQRTAEVVEVLAALFPSDANEPDQWPRCAQLLAHAFSVFDHANGVELVTPALASLLGWTGMYVHTRGLDVRLAKELHEQALAMRRRLYDGDHPDVAKSLSNLAVDLTALEEHERARELDEEALAMSQRLYDGDHPTVASSLDNLAVDLNRLGEHERARELAKQALAMYQRLYEGDHLDLAISLNNLAVDMADAGKHERARELAEQALAMYQRLYEGDHPELAKSLNNVASVLSDAGELERAEKLAEQALTMRQRLYEGDHPDVAGGLNNLAIHLAKAGQHARARELNEEALAMRQRLYEGDHPDVAASLNNLAIELKVLGDDERAHVLGEQALAMYRRLAE